MAYKQNIALARIVSKTLRGLGLRVTRSLNESSMRVSSPEGGTVVLECRKDQDDGKPDIDIWIPPSIEETEAWRLSTVLMSTLKKIFRESGWR